MQKPGVASAVPLPHPDGIREILPDENRRPQGTNYV